MPAVQWHYLIVVQPVSCRPVPRPDNSHMMRTKVTRLLDEHQVPYRILPHNEPVFTVEKAAAQRGVAVEEMVKSLLLRERKNHRYVMACVPGEARLDPKAVRAYLGQEKWKRLSFASSEEIENITGFVPGAVAPLGLPENIPVIFDETILQHTQVNISSGDPLAGLEVDSQTLAKLAGAQFAPIVEKRDD